MLCFGDHVAVLNDFFNQTGGSMFMIICTKYPFKPLDYMAGQNALSNKSIQIGNDRHLW
jgi:hypothetical protein